MSRIVSRGCLTLLVGTVVIGCAPSTTTNTEMDPVGTYTLVQVDGATLPCTVSHLDQPMVIHSGQFTIRDDGTCDSTTEFAVADREPITRQVSATYHREEEILTMQWKGAGTTIGALEASTFTMTNEGMAFTYHKAP